MKRLLWWIAGANVFILDQCPSDQDKYTKTGLAILFTSIIAGFTGGFAIYISLGEDFQAGLIFGIIWGIIILILDSLIVSGIKTNDKAWEKLQSASPRIVLSLFIGLIIAHPFELRLFQEEIRQKAQEQQIDRGQELVQQTNHLYAVQMNGLMFKEESLNDRINQFEEKISCLSTLLIHEKNGEKVLLSCGSSSGKSGTLARYNDISDELSYSKEEKGKLQNELMTLKGQTVQLSNRIETREKELNIDFSPNKPVSLLAGHVALMALMKENSEVFWMAFFITLLILFIELIPVLSKLMQIKGRYDQLVEELTNASTNEEAYHQLLEKYPALQLKNFKLAFRQVRKSTSIQKKMLFQKKQLALSGAIKGQIENIQMSQWLESLKLTNNITLKEQLEEAIYRIKSKQLQQFELTQLQALEEKEEQQPIAKIEDTQAHEKEKKVVSIPQEPTDSNMMTDQVPIDNELAKGSEEKPVFLPKVNNDSDSPTHVTDEHKGIGEENLIKEKEPSKQAVQFDWKKKRPAFINSLH